MKVHRITDLFNDKLWKLDQSIYHNWYGKLVRYVKLIRLTVRTFLRNRMGFQCVALSYFVTLAIIPMVALIFAISDGLRFSGKIAEIISNIYPSNPELANVMMDKANNIIDLIRGGGVGLISAFIFFSTVVWMMFQTERVFNNVWGILKIPRKLYKRLGFYVLIMAIFPFVLLMFGTGIAFYSNFLGMLNLNFQDFTFVKKIIGYTLMYILSVFTLMLMYKYIPATYVNIRYAFKAAVAAALVFTVFQYVYLETQTFVARLNKVYGVIAAIPLFMIWVNFSWQIIIYGAELCYSYKRVESYSSSKKKSEK